MHTQATASKSAARRHRPKTLTVFAAAFAAGAVLAYGVDRMVDVHVVRVLPQVESEPIFVALRSLPQGSPITVWDVALKDWPKAMLPTTALRADASFEGMVLRHPVREGQPLLSVQLVRDGAMLPGGAIATLPAATGPMSAGIPTAPPDRGVTIGEPFVPAAPAEPAATAAAATSPPPAVESPEPARVSPPAAEPSLVGPVGATPASETTPVAEVEPPVEPASIVAADGPVQAAAPAIVAVVQPRSTDVDETVVAPADAPASAPIAATTAAEPTPDVAVAAPVPVAAPTQAPVSTSPPMTPAIAIDAGQMPLAPPVPALPSTDIERSLAKFGHAHAEPDRLHAAPTGQPASVLDRTTEAAPPTADPAAPKLHLVVPERIALAVDASFTQPQPPAQPERSDQATESPRGTAPAATAPQGRAAASRSQATAGKPTTSNPATRKPSNPRQPAARPQPPQGRGVSAWLPTFLGGSRQR